MTQQHHIKMIREPLEHNGHSRRDPRVAPIIPWHTLDVSDALAQLGADRTLGLDADTAAQRLGQYGPNLLEDGGVRPVWRVLWEQMTSTSVVILIVAALFAMLLGDLTDTLAILVIVMLNALLGFHQEYRAEQAMASLKRLTVPRVRARRDGRVTEISSRDLVPGDILLLDAGNLVSADGRILESTNLRLQESILTGEADVVEKHVTRLPRADLPVSDRANMAFAGTTVTYGRGVIVVTNTGMETQLGRIATILQNVATEPTPLQRRLDRLGKSLAVVVLLLIGVIFLLGLVRGEPAREMFLTAVSMAVAAIPEGLPAVVTVALALGGQRLLRRGALIRKLASVETLGSVTVICSDKTGTLTENRMAVSDMETAGHRLDFGQLAGAAPGAADSTALDHLPRDYPAFPLLLLGGALCNDSIAPSRTHDEAIGDPTETALQMAALRAGLQSEQLTSTFPRLAEVPFTADRRRMTTLHCYRDDADTRLFARMDVAELLSASGSAARIAFSKGAVENVLEIATRILAGRTAVPLDERWRERILAANEALASEGKRVLGIGFRPLESAQEPPLDDLETDFIFIGIVGLVDPPRSDAKSAVETCKRAGIRPILITGDHPETARCIARAVGIATEPGMRTGDEISRLTDPELRDVVARVSVFARVSPEHKLLIVQALQQQGHFVAMTGDGVNDAPALKRADIGIAMGLQGTDVAKEAAEMVLLDDHFATIVASVEEGRVIYDNIRKFIKYLLVCNSGELWVMLLAPFVGMPLPLLPLQILWMNLVTDGLPALALSLEPAERNVMSRPPYPTDAPILRGMVQQILLFGLMMGLVSLTIGYVYWHAHRPEWQTMVFTTLTLSQMGAILALRSERESLFRRGLFSNKPLLAAILMTLGLQFVLIYVPALHGPFKTQPLSGPDMIIALAVSTIGFAAMELEKAGRRRLEALKAKSK